MDSLSSVVILRHLAFVKNLKVDFLLFRVVEGNMGVVFHFAFELVDHFAFECVIIGFCICIGC